MILQTRTDYDEKKMARKKLAMYTRNGILFVQIDIGISNCHM